MDGISSYASLGSLGAPDMAKLLAPSNASAPADSAPAARRFQEMLGTMLVKEMRRTLPEGFFGGGASGDVYGGWLDEHVGASLASRDSLHLESVLRESIDRKARQAEVKS
jgi:Rod binding domain-containing protein